ncbi:hypothetical protein DL98DRAFT_590997 [Cadophora sp. DSE1049]|nr:hypothetical protein DL98DRAFT_590997 [Cadophora sp. DSE1049]
MKHAVFNFIALFAGSTLSLTLPGILPDPNSLPEAADRNTASLRLGCIAAIAIGFLFGSLFLVWIGLIVYHAVASLLRLRKGEEEEIDYSIKSDAVKSEEEEKKTWGDSYRAGPVLGTIFGLVFALWGLLFVWNMVDAIDILGKI